MSDQNTLPSRAQQILHSVVRSYIETGEPVSSRRVSRLRRDNLSPASVRNAMADLADEGYLSQPHSSSGRVPTLKAFQCFVRSLAAVRPAAVEVSRIRGELRDAETVEGRVELTSLMLTAMTSGVGIAAAIPNSSRMLDQVDLLWLGERRVLMIVVTRDKMVRDRVVTLDEPISQDELNSIRNYLNWNFSGRVFSDIQDDLRARLAKASAAYDAILRKLVLLYEKGLLEIGLAPEVHMEGASNLLRIDLHLTQEKMRELFCALEEKKRILQLLDRFLDQQPAGEVAVQIGLGEEHPSMGELSLIGVRVHLSGGLAAKIAVLGPMRMNYERAMSAVLYVGQAFQSLPV